MADLVEWPGKGFDSLRRASQALRDGRIVALPTEAG
jgi:tRNA A37 threonylcarbamoyladenosine synthetase subunit TsaC/SUA5/YrdC